MLGKLLYQASRIHPVRRAVTDEERDAAYRLRFRVIRDRARLAGLDPQAALDADPGVRSDLELVVDNEDDLPESEIFVVGDPGAIVGTVRIRMFPAGTVPPQLVERFAMDAFDTLGDRAVCAVERLLMKPEAHGSTALVALTCQVLDHVVRAQGVELIFLNVPPDRLASSRKLGLRPFASALRHVDGEDVVPLVGIVADLTHLRHVGSPWQPVVSALKAEGLLNDMDLAPLLEVVRAVDDDGADLSDAVIESQVAHAFEPAATGLFDTLPPRTRQRLETGGYLRSVTQGTALVRRGQKADDVYVILKGAFLVKARGQHVATLGAGDVFGEVAFFRPSSVRTASVEAMSNGRVLVISRAFLDELEADHPREAAVVYRALAACMADRLG